MDPSGPLVVEFLVLLSDRGFHFVGQQIAGENETESRTTFRQRNAQPISARSLLKLTVRWLSMQASWLVISDQRTGHMDGRILVKCHHGEGRGFFRGFVHELSRPLQTMRLRTKRSPGATIK